MAITVRQALLYVKTMQSLSKAKSHAQALRQSLKLLEQFFTIPHRKIMQESAVELLTAAKTLHFAMQSIILPKFGLLIDNPEPIEKSVFDEYDKEQDERDGVVDESRDPWKVHEKNIEAVTRLAIRVFRDSYSNVQRAEIAPLLEHIAYEMKQKD